MPDYAPDEPTIEEIERMLWAIDKFGWDAVGRASGEIVLSVLRAHRQRLYEERLVGGGK